MTPRNLRGHGGRPRSDASAVGRIPWLPAKRRSQAKRSGYRRLGEIEVRVCSQPAAKIDAAMLHTYSCPIARNLTDTSWTGTKALAGAAVQEVPP